MIRRKIRELPDILKRPLRFEYAWNGEQAVLADPAAAEKKLRQVVDAMCKHLGVHLSSSALNLGPPGLDPEASLDDVIVLQKLAFKILSPELYPRAFKKPHGAGVKWSPQRKRDLQLFIEANRDKAGSVQKAAAQYIKARGLKRAKVKTVSRLYYQTVKEPKSVDDFWPD